MEVVVRELALLHEGAAHAEAVLAPQPVVLHLFRRVLGLATRLALRRSARARVPATSARAPHPAPAGTREGRAQPVLGRDLGIRWSRPARGAGWRRRRRGCTSSGAPASAARSRACPRSRARAGGRGRGRGRGGGGDLVGGARRRRRPPGPRPRVVAPARGSAAPAGSSAAAAAGATAPGARSRRWCRWSTRRRW